MGKSNCVGRISVAAAGGVAECCRKAFGIELHCLHIDGLACISTSVSWGYRNQNSLKWYVGQRDLLTISSESE